jgi:anti-sigma factor RsiW
MATEDCATMEMLLQADCDGELDVGGTEALAAHLATCPDCQAKQVALSDLSARLRAELPRHEVPARLRAAIEAAMPRPQAARRDWRALAENWLRSLVPLGAGAAIAAGALLLVLPQRAPDMADSIVESHIRALQPGHLMDVVSTDQHTVKPWFDGRIDFAPPVKDLAAEGFPLVGGRLDYLGGRPVAALAYKRGQHVIDLYVWPGRQGAEPPADGARNGYNFLRWTQDDMVFWAVSDLNAAELGDFAATWRAPH